jgi:hypothetical protein
MDAFQAIAKRLHCPSQVNVCSMAQRRGQSLEAAAGVGAFDDLDPPVALAIQGAEQFRPSIAAVGEEMAQPGPAFGD